MNVFESISKSPNDDKARKFDEQMKRAINELMRTDHGRLFLRWLGMGQSAQSILTLVMDYQDTAMHK